MKVYKAKLDANESPFDLPAEIKAQILTEAYKLDFNRYESPHLDIARNLLAHRYRVDPGCILFGNGSDELIQLTTLTYGDPDNPVVLTTPTFSMYRFVADQIKSPVVAIPLSLPDFSLDIKTLLATLSQYRTPLLFLCRPNNPTGGSIPLPVVETILDSTDGPVVVDEAYSEFTGTTVLTLLDRYPNLIILRTLSKAYRSAGLRVGYLLAQPSVVAQIQKRQMPYTMGVFSQLAARIILENHDQVLALVEDLLAWKENLVTGLRNLPGVSPLKSETNYVLFKVPVEAALLQRQLAQRGVLVRHYPSDPDLAHYLRVSVGTPAENNLFLTELAALIAEGGNKQCS